MRKHALIVGAPGVGKSTLIDRVLEELGCPVWGFETKKETDGELTEEGFPVYLYQLGRERRRTEENLVGRCRKKCICVRPEAFDRYAGELKKPVPAGHAVKMDELGFLEASSRAFCEAVLEKLDGDAPVIAAVKNRDIPFLQAVRSHPRGEIFFITEENREELFGQVLAFMREQMK